MDSEPVSIARDYLKIQSSVNHVIKSDLLVSETFVLKEEAQGMYDMHKLPEDVDGKVRIVHLGNYDACPCIGKHVSSTGEIGRFKITTTSFKDGVLRIRFKLS
jgi:Ser-tRNA(Ala) deacylase AlaX